jgi:hypothetical protein
LIEPPSNFCTSDRFSRSVQNALRCSSVAAIAASSISPRSCASASSAVSASSSPLETCEAASIRTYQAWRALRGSRVREHEVERDARHQLEAGDGLTQRGAREPEKRQGLRRIGQADEGGGARARIGKQLQCRRRDDSERALGADEEVLQVVASVVLAQFRQGFDDPPVGQHHLEPGREIPRVAVGEHRDAARVGRQIAADRAGSLRGQRKRKQAIRALRRGLRLPQRHASLDDHGVGERIDFADAVHAPQREDDRRAAAVGRLASHQPRVAALGHDRSTRRRAGLHDRSDLGGRARTDHRERAAVIEPARFAEIARHQTGIGEHVRGRD